MHKILEIILYFPLDALHVSGYISSSSGATFKGMYQMRCIHIVG
jgi:hypothetical protein